MSSSAPTTSSRRPRSSQTTILLALIALRLFNALTIRTFFQPDEYFQALEPAWLMAFGYETSPYVTWEWRLGLRSSLHPRLFATLYTAVDYAASIASISPHYRAEVLILVPKVTQAVLAAIGDWYTWRLAKSIYDEKRWIPEATLLMTVLSPWQWYVSTRTFSNSLETVLTIAALYYWPWRLFADVKQEKTEALKAPGEKSGLRVSLLLAAIAVLLRPTNILIWFSISTILLTRLSLDGQSPITASVVVVLAREVILCGGIILGITAVSDRYFYDDWVFPPYKFLYFNLAQSLAVFYGQNDWHYYLSQGIPLLSFGILPFVLYGLWKALGSNPGQEISLWSGNVLRTLGFAAVALMGALSLISHKEVRFIYPLLPIFHLVAAPYIVSHFTEAVAREPTNKKSPMRDAITIKNKPLLVVILTINFVVGVYLSYFHAGAPMAVLDFLRHEWEDRHPNQLSMGVDAIPQEASFPSSVIGPPFVVFLVPCHTSPWRSHLVYSELTGRALTCSPPLDTLPGSEERRNYKSETDLFYDNITEFLERPIKEEWSLTWGPNTPFSEAAGLPQFIVGFSGIRDELLGYFEDGLGSWWNAKLEERWAMWNGLFSDDWKREGYLIVWEVVQSSDEESGV
ncbi:hypothetical protein MKZ38_010333 [Zalerion maritima]|uniref:Mannosyltransferase n=1 Tax=Zalerion maritima TaxID=339359 RepID=A0AAD5WVU3_9PEZI|nr:hypothetical protein MKZ38_010333 [Zalerion maritima]